MKAQNGFFYRGPSMAPTFKKGDLLYFQGTPGSELRCGDTVIFYRSNAEGLKSHCVHRIVSRPELSIVTRGDNNPKNDEEQVMIESLIGKVTRFERNGKTHEVWNGSLGLLRGRLLHKWGHVKRTAKFLLRKPYRLIKKTGIVAKLWRPQIETIRFETRDGPLIKYIHKGRTVANCWTESNHWWFRRPYDLLCLKRA